VASTEHAHDDPLPGSLQVSQQVGAAVGIIMVQRELSYPDACAFLRDLGIEHGQTLPDLARDITAIGWTRPLRFGPERHVDRSHPAGAGRSPHPDESLPGRVLDLLIETSTRSDLLGAIAELAVETVPGCESASITVIRGATPATIASSDARALEVDQSQYGYGHGPCLHAARTDSIVRIDDVAAAPWRHEVWAVTARAAGVSATMSLPIAVGPDVAAALNLYAGADGGWPDQAQVPAEALAAYTGDAIIMSDRLHEPHEQAPPGSHSGRR
jgi:hypothetical protein